MSRKIYCDGCAGELQNGDATFTFGNEVYCEDCFIAVVEEMLFDMNAHELADLFGATVEYVGEE